jgi:hypothetical protein
LGERKGRRGDQEANEEIPEHGRQYRRFGSDPRRGFLGGHRVGRRSALTKRDARQGTTSCWSQ